MKRKFPPKRTSNQSSHSRFKKYIQKALREAYSGIHQNHGGPFGAVVIIDNKIVSSAHNTVLRDNDPTCHAEVNAIRKACKKLKSPHLEGAILIASSEPCPMCLTTSYWAKIKTIYYGLPKSVASKFGFIDDFIYKDLKKSLPNRKLKLTHIKDLQTEGLQIFSQWKKENGKIY